MFDSIQKRLLVYVLSITTLFLLGIGILNYLWAERVVVDLSEQRTAAMADAAAAKIEGYLLQKGQNAWTLAQNEQIHSFIEKISLQEVDLSEDKDYQEMMTSFQRIVTLNPDIKFVYVGVDKTDRLYGNIEFTYPQGYKVSERPWYKAAAQERKLVFTGPYICPLTGNYVTTASVPIYSNNDELLGVAAVDMPVSRIEQIVNSVHIGQTGYAFMLDDQGNTITHPSSSNKGKPMLEMSKLNSGMPELINRMVNGEKGIVK
ncbi:MAG: cache domain-containing protein, partial [Syntrophomonas sp.]